MLAEIKIVVKVLKAVIEKSLKKCSMWVMKHIFNSIFFCYALFALLTISKL